MIKQKYFLYIILAFFFLFCKKDSKVVLIENDKTNYVLLAEQPNTIAVAKELQKYLSKATGITFKITDTPTAQKKHIRFLIKNTMKPQE